MSTIVDLCPYWSWPPAFGGSLRVNQLNNAVSRYVNILQFSVRPTYSHMNSGLSKWIGSKFHKHNHAYQEYQYFHPLILATSFLLYKCGCHSDIFLSEFMRLTRPKQLKVMLGQASVLQVEHPWLFPFAKEVSVGKPIIYVAHNVETTLWEKSEVRVFPKSWKHLPRKLEEYATQNANAIVAMSEQDARKLVNEFGAQENIISVIPNGVDLSIRIPPTNEEKLTAKKQLGLTEKTIVLFVGSEHFPNREALSIIQSWQGLIGENIHFVIVGSVGVGIPSTQSITIAGFVKDIKAYLYAADIAVNPLITGSGTSLKIIEYLACGIPTITTLVGMRGLNFEPNKDLMVGTVDEFPGLIKSLSSDTNLKKKLSLNGRKTVEVKYGWPALAEKMMDVYRKVGL